MPYLVLEIGTEEMPAGAIEDALGQLRGAVENGLRALRLEAPRVEVLGTPRRLIVRAAGVPGRQPDQQREVRGPSRSVAFDAAGKPTGAAIGFARKQGVPVEALETVATPQGEYVLARVTDTGKPVAEVLGPMLADAARSLFFPKMMRWGQGGTRFVRPVRWLLALLDDQIVPMELAGVPSGRTSRGHRFLAPDEFEVATASELLDKLRAAFVLCDPEERRAAIREQGDALAAEVGGAVPWDEGLLDENTWLVEWPTALRGGFDPDYLALPRPVLVTAMKKHQRFFPVQGTEGRLLPYFIAVRNGGSEHLDLVRDGNQRVLTARFADARYFFDQDRQTSLDQMAEGLGRLVFQEKLGTMADKRRRLELLVASLADSLQLSAAQRALAVRAASLAKADLVSRMVVELPALQGEIGREYALSGGEDAAVAAAVAEHYLPRSASDTLPATGLGKILAVADRMDTLVGYLGLGITPSGSSDPYGLRRAAQGVVQILAREPEACPLVSIEIQAAHAYREVNGLDLPLDPLCNDLQQIFDQRLEAYLDERGVRYDLVAAALSGGPIFTTLVYAIVRRADTLQTVASDPQFVLTTQAAARVANILRSARPDDGPLLPGKEGIHGVSGSAVERAVSVLETESRKVVLARLVEPAEPALYDAACAVMPEVARRAADYDFGAVYQALQPLREAVDRFFDDVLVMAPEPDLRRNRLALLSFVDALYTTLADFTRVVVA